VINIYYACEIIFFVTVLRQKAKLYANATKLHVCCYYYYYYYYHRINMLINADGIRDKKSHCKLMILSAKVKHRYARNFYEPKKKLPS